MNVSTCATERPGVGGRAQRSLALVDRVRSQAVTRSRVIKLAIANDYPLVSAGVAAMLADAPIDVVRVETPLRDHNDIDIVLYDPCGPGSRPPAGPRICPVGANAKLVIYSWDIQPGVAQRAVRQGAAGCLAKSLPGPVMVGALERIMLGEIVVIAEDGAGSGGGDNGSPMPTDGLSPRETEVLALIAGGLTNLEIAARLYVSINSVKAYIRSAYRKIGVERRTQAVLWGVRQGLAWDPDPAGEDDLSAEVVHPAGTDGLRSVRG